MIDERFIELLLQQVEHEKSEKLALMAELKALREEVAILRAQHYESNIKHEGLVREMNERISRLTEIAAAKDSQIASLNETISKMALTTDEMAHANKGLTQQLKLQMGKRFARTSEQAKLLNNQNIEVRTAEKASFDGKEAKTT